jgi:outer membrane lipoprotein SlyB
MRKLTLAIAAASMTVPVAAVIPTTAASAHYTKRAHSHQNSYQGRTWRGNNGRMYCRKPNGTTGLLVGGAAGALAGRAIDTRGDRATGTILGAAVGALLGRHVQRNVVSRCR